MKKLNFYKRPLTEYEYMDFIGKSQIINDINKAMTLADSSSTVNHIRRALTNSINQGLIELPAICFKSRKDHYARHLMHVCPKYGYSIIVMTWGPNQGTLIHDHSGLWCVEGVISGQLEINQYEITKQQEDKYWFEHVACINANAGTAGSLLPPHEYHTIENTDSNNPAVSMHIYSQAMISCHVFHQQDDGSYLCQEKQLSTDD